MATMAARLDKELMAEQATLRSQAEVGRFFTGLRLVPRDRAGARVASRLGRGGQPGGHHVRRGPRPSDTPPSVHRAVDRQWDRPGNAGENSRRTVDCLWTAKESSNSGRRGLVPLVSGQ